MESIKYPAPKHPYKVLVMCFTYNHYNYINDALNGFALQKTNFPFVCLVMDDASTDGTQDVIKDWVTRECDMSKSEIIDISTSIVIIVHHKINKSCTFVFYLLKQNLYSLEEKKMNHIYPWRAKCEYEALCEGDDYWIDPFKLQIQVDFLDKNQGYSMCFHKARILKENPSIFSSIKCDSIENRDYQADELLKDWIIPTASLVYRKEVNSKYTFVMKENKILNGDIVLVLSCAETGKVRGLSSEMSVYRVHNSGITYDEKLQKHRLLRYPEHFLCIKRNFKNVSRKIINKYISEYYFRRFFLLLREDSQKAFMDLVSAFYYHPFLTLKKIIGILYAKLQSI